MNNSEIKKTVRLALVLVFYGCRLFAGGITGIDTLSPVPYYNKACILHNSRFSNSGFEVNVYLNAWALYYDERYAGQKEKMNKLGLKELRNFPRQDSLGFRIYYIHPDSVKYVNRIFRIYGNYFEWEKGSGILTRQVYMRFKEGIATSDRADTILKKYCLKNSRCTFTQSTYFLYTRSDKMLEATWRTMREPEVSDIWNRVWLKGDKMEKWEFEPVRPGNIVKKQKMFNDTLLFSENRDAERADMAVYSVKETDSTFADTLYLLSHTLEYNSTFEMNYETEAAVYEASDSTVVFYNNTFSFDELFGAPYQNPKLYNTFRELYIYNRNGKLTLQKTEFGTQDSKMKNKKLDAEIRKRTQATFDRIRHY